MLDPSSTLLPHYQSHTPDFVLGNHLFPGFLPVPVSLSHGSDWLQLLECPISLLQMMSSVTNSGRDMLSNQPLQPREIAGKVHLVFWEGLLENIFEWKWKRAFAIRKGEASQKVGAGALYGSPMLTLRSKYEKPLRAEKWWGKKVVWFLEKLMSWSSLSGQNT